MFGRSVFPAITTATEEYNLGLSFRVNYDPGDALSPFGCHFIVFSSASFAFMEFCRCQRMQICCAVNTNLQEIGIY